MKGDNTETFFQFAVQRSCRKLEEITKDQDQLQKLSALKNDTEMFVLALSEACNGVLFVTLI